MPSLSASSPQATSTSDTERRYNRHIRDDDVTHGRRTGPIGIRRQNSSQEDQSDCVTLGSSDEEEEVDNVINRDNASTLREASSEAVISPLSAVSSLSEKSQERTRNPFSKESNMTTDEKEDFNNGFSPNLARTKTAVSAGNIYTGGIPLRSRKEEGLKYRDKLSNHKRGPSKPFHDSMSGNKCMKYKYVQQQLDKPHSPEETIFRTPSSISPSVSSRQSENRSITKPRREASASATRPSRNSGSTTASNQSVCT